MYISKLQKCSVTKAQVCKWFTQESFACISCVIGTTGKSVVNHQPCLRSKACKTFEHFKFWTEGRKLFVFRFIYFGKKHYVGLNCMCFCMHTYSSVWHYVCVSVCMFLCMCVCVARTWFYVQRKWLTVKNVTNSNFNCQWKKDSIFMGSVQTNRGEGFLAWKHIPYHN